MSTAERNADPSQASSRDLERVQSGPPDPGISFVPPAVRSRPMAPLASYASDDDYPASALRGGEQGRAGFVLDIGADGRVTNCRIMAPSGSAALDSVSCRVMRSRARYTPARDAQGNPVPDRHLGELNWTLPRD
jgi:protein TonB